jgi:glycosyltransferase involved in cell wall biosynthesis
MGAHRFMQLAMQLLLIHQNFPGQFRHLALGLQRRGHRVVALGQGGAASPLSGIIQVNDPGCVPADPEDPRSELELALERGRQVAGACARLRDQGFRPDAVLFHSAWGEGFDLRDVWPDVPLVAYPELHGSTLLLGYGFDADLREPPADLAAQIRRQNLISLAAVVEADAVVCPTQFQRNTFPAPLRGRISVIHEGVDLDVLHPRADICVRLASGLLLRPGDPVVTYCSRHLEPLRGFRTLMRALPALQLAHPEVQVVIVGENSRGYGPGSCHGDGHRGEMLELLQGRLDLERIHFLDRIPYEHLISLWQVSAAHVYLSYPYALSWSALEAMACGAPLVGSRGPTLEEVISSGENGLLVDFNDPAALAASLLQLLEEPDQRARLARAGRATVEQRYSLGMALDRYETLLQDLSAATRSPGP